MSITNIAVLRITGYFDKIICAESMRQLKEGARGRDVSIVQKRIIIRQALDELDLNSHRILVAAADSKSHLYVPMPVVACTEKEISAYVEQELPCPSTATVDEIDEIMLDRRTMRMRLNRERRWGIAALSLHLRLVGGATGNKKVTPKERHERLLKNRAADRFVASHVLQGAGGEVLKMSDAGKTKRKALSGLYCMSKGIEQYAGESGMQWAMCVITLPPEYHPNPTSGKNSWSGVLPDQARRRLAQGLTRVYDRARKNDISLAGMWTIEAHKDACPHLNVMLYFSPGAEDDLQKYFEDEFGVTDQSVEWRIGQTGEGMAKFSSYAMKYIMKFFADSEDPDMLEEQAWGSAWRIRRIGFFGIPSRVQWDRLRASAIPPKHDPLLTRMWRAARGGRFGGYIGLCGGLNVRQSQRPTRTVSALSRTGRSRVSVGVENIKTGVRYISKTVGYWTITHIKNAMQPVLEAASNGISVLSLSYPSGRGGTRDDLHFADPATAFFSFDPPF